MKFEVKRYHIIASAAAVNLLAAVLIFSRENSPTLMESLEKSQPPVVRSTQAAVPVPLFPPITPKQGKKSAPIRRPAAPPPALPTEKRIALTFDDGPHPGLTERLLDILRVYRVPATFFVVGKQVERYPDLLQRIYQEGHEVANHTYSHRDMRTLSASEITRELEKTERLVEQITDEPMRFFRPPGGQYNLRVIERGQDLGFRMVLWNVFPQDHLNPPAPLIRERVLRTARDGGIVLLHSGVENTMLALPGIIQTLREEGYSFVRVSDLEGSFPPSVPILARSSP